MRSRRSTTVTSTPRVAAIEAYSSIDHPGADDRKTLGDGAQPEQAVGIQHPLPVELRARRARRSRVDRDHEAPAGNPAAAQLERVRIGERRAPDQHVDRVAPQLVAHRVQLMLDHRPGAPQEVVHRQLVLPVAGEGIGAEYLAGQLDDRRAQSLSVQPAPGPRTCRRARPHAPRAPSVFRAGLPEPPPPWRPCRIRSR